MAKKRKKDPKPPIEISGSVIKMLTHHLREWSEEPKASLSFGVPDGGVSDIAETKMDDLSVRIDPEKTLLNPNRVYRDAIPFRMRQEAVITGVLMHESAHIKYSGWVPSTPDEVEALKELSGVREGFDAALSLALVLEEVRIERAFKVGRLFKGDPTWTMQAATAHLLGRPTFRKDPAESILDFLVAWILRGLRHEVREEETPLWTRAYRELVLEEIEAWLDSSNVSAPVTNLDTAQDILTRCFRAVTHPGVDQGQPIRHSLYILRALFPNTPLDELPSAGEACSLHPGEGDTGDEEGDESGDEEGDGTDSKSDVEASSEDETQGEGGVSQQTLDTLGNVLDAMDEAQSEAEEKAKEGSYQPPTPQAFRGWRDPTAEERQIQREATRLLRGLVDPSEKNVTTLSESPAATVDPAELAAWKAGGQMRDPMFFRRTRREQIPQPPVKIAVLVDVSLSMEEAQLSSAVLSWSLAQAALDLQNFAGRGTQTASCLIHWGNSSEVIQKPGELLPGIRRVACDQGTTAMIDAFEDIERSIPGFFSDHSSNRLIVQFTDWGMNTFQRAHKDAAYRAASKAVEALDSGIKMLSVLPSDLQGNKPSWLAEVELKTKNPELSKSLHMVSGEVDPRIWSIAAEILSK